jgi:hypothetical protein
VVSYGMVKVGIPAIVHEKEPLSRSPKRCRAELSWKGLALLNSIRIFHSQIVKRKVRIRSVGGVLQTGLGRICGREAVGMTQDATNSVWREPPVTVLQNDTLVWAELPNRQSSTRLLTGCQLLTSGELLM